MPANGLRVNHYDFVALHSMWIVFLKGLCILLRVEIIHKSEDIIYKPEDLVVDEFFSTVPDKNFDLCVISTRTKIHKPFRKTILGRLYLAVDQSSLDMYNRWPDGTSRSSITDWT